MTKKGTRKKPARGKRGRGRPTKFTPDRLKEILDAAEDGATIEGCARAGGVSYETLNGWLNKGEGGDPDYLQFFHVFMEHRSKGETKLLKATLDRKPEFILERSFGYVKTERHEHTGKDGGAIEFRAWLKQRYGETTEDSK